VALKGRTCVETSSFSHVGRGKNKLAATLASARVKHDDPPIRRVPTFHYFGSAKDAGKGDCSR
jgi:hypothetical protein